MRCVALTHFDYPRARAIALWNKQLLPAAEEQMNQWLQSAIDEGDYSQAAAAANALGACYSAYGRHNTAVDLFSLAKQHYLKSQTVDADLPRKIITNRITTLWACGEADRAWDEVEEYLSAAAPESQDPRLLLLRGGLALERGALEQAHHDLTRSAELYQRQGSSHLAAMATSNLGIVHAQKGDLSLAHTLIETALSSILAAGDYRHAAYAFTELGLLAQRQGRFTTALEYCSRSLKHLLSDITTLDRREIANVCRVLALSFKSIGDIERADNYARRALNFYRNQVNPYIIKQGKHFEEQYATIQKASQPETLGDHSSFYQWEYGLNYIEASLSMIDTAEQMDQYTVGHSARVMGYCAVLAAEMAIATNIKDILLFAARFHDIGKVFIPRDILTKPDVLLETDWVLMRRHPSMGANMVRMLLPNSPAAELIESHHERYDGSGYPHGLKQDEIILASHILSVADAYDAMTSNRAYRLALGHSRAMVVLQSESSKQFHPCVVEAWHKIHQL